jgi:hydrogenase-4 component F
VIAILLIITFVGFLNHFRSMYFHESRGKPDKAPPISGWCVVPMALALVPLFVMGLWWPDRLWDHFLAIAASLSTTSAGSSP